MTKQKENLTTTKKIIFSTIVVASMVCAMEGVFYLEYQIRDLQFRLDDYILTKANSQLMVWDNTNKVMTPLPNNDITIMAPQFIDKFRTFSLSESPVVIWNDPPKNEQFVGIALGDSFTRGVGSLYPNKASWPSIISNRNPRIEIVNLGDAGASAKQHLVRYKKIGHLIPHNFVIQAMIPSDFFETTSGCSFEDILDRLPSNINPVDYYKDYFILKKIYTPELEYFSKTTIIKSYTIYSLLRLAKRFIQFSPGGNYKKYNDIWEGICEQIETDDQFQQEQQIKQSIESLHGEMQTICPMDGNICMRFFTHLMKDGNDSKKKDVINYLGMYIKALSAEAEKNGAKFFLIIFPEKQQTYFYKYGKDYLRSLNPFYPVEELKRSIGSDIMYYDMTSDFTLAAKEYESKGKYLYYKTNGHWNPYGYAVTADLIEKFIEQAIDDHSNY